MEQVGKYVLEDEIGAGGMAQVFRASVVGPEGFRKRVAVKRVLPARIDNEAFVKMFITEAQQTARLDHPNIVQVYDFFESDGAYYIVMELVDGSDLRHILRKLVSRDLLFPIEHATFILGELLKALHCAHSQKPAIVHRDVTPSNVFVSYGGNVKLGDFGIARPAAEAAEYTASIVGKLRYLAPEQAQRLRPDGRADLYSAGIVTWEMLARRRFPELDPETQTAPSPRQFRPEVPEDLERVLAKLLVRERDGRCPRAEDALNDLHACGCYRPNNLAVGAWVENLIPRRPTTAPSAEALSMAGAVRRKMTPPPIGADSAGRSRTPLPLPVGDLLADEMPTSALTPSVRGDTGLTRPRTTGLPRRAIFVAAGLAAAIGAFAAVRAVGGWRSPAPAPAASAPPVAHPAPAAPRIFRIELRPDPATAELSLDDAPIAERSLALPAGSKHRVVARAPGYTDGAVDFVADGDRTVTITLAPAPARIEKARSMRGRKKGESSISAPVETEW